MKNIFDFMSILIALTVFAFTSYVGADEGEDEQQHTTTKSIGEGAKHEKLTKEERKALHQEKKDIKKMRKEMKADGEFSPEEKKAIQKARENRKKHIKAKKEAKEAPVVPTDKQIEKADQEDELGEAEAQD